MSEEDNFPKKENNKKIEVAKVQPSITYMTDSSKQPQSIHEEHISSSKPASTTAHIKTHKPHPVHHSNPNDLIEIRKEKVISFIKKKYDWITYIFLALIVWLSVNIRTQNLSGLRDVSTGGWTLGPDLDPFLFLRWAKEIIANGSLAAVDKLRYVPLGFNTNEELVLHPHLIAIFHKFAVVFGSTSIDQSAAIYPVFMFALTIIAFFFMTRAIFISSLGKTKSNIIALIASFFLTVIPSLLPRTIAGIPEKESVGFLFLFLTFYFFISSRRSEKQLSRYLLALGSGISTAAMALVWGGFTYIFVTLGIVALIAFLIGQMNRENAYTYTIWLVSSIALMYPFSSRFSLSNLLNSTTTGIAFLALGIIILHEILQIPSLKKVLSNSKLSKLSPQLVTLIITIILGLIFSTIFFGPGFITHKLGDIKQTLVTPVTDRLGVTVAENRQPFFDEWANSFGPVFNGIPLFFWLFFIGSISLFYFMVRDFKKDEKVILTSAYIIFLIATIFSRYSPNNLFNGTNFQSILFYALGFIIILATSGYYYFKHYKQNGLEDFSKIDLGILLLFVFFFLSIVSARGAVRLIMVLVPSSAILASYLAVFSISEVHKVKDDLLRLFSWICIILIVLATLYSGQQFYLTSNSSAKAYVPSPYTNQWQYAMSWVRDNLPQDAVFGHWWDYGYWVQSIGERATVLDGGNAIPYWNYLMGRHALTGRTSEEALGFLYAHDTTHFLIDSTDIGKYGAFSSIGSNEVYDRRSFFPFFQLQSAEETKNTTLYLYTGGAPLDQDIIYNTENVSLILPEGRAGLAGIIVEKDKSGNLVTQPRGIFLDQKNGQQVRYDIPFRYSYQKNKLVDHKSGIESGIFFMPTIDFQTGTKKDDNVIMYLSNKTSQSNLARWYLYKENDPYFKLVHTEDDLLVKQLKDAGILGKDEDFVYYQGIRGPIRIWEIKYPSDMKVDPIYLQKNYPDIKLLRSA
ncbi:hypothetical protein COU54_00650 [Candidatus Pacearchaeota archaeon CG10_big_fil_rev_8_21_14_0_10_31_24]|nr:MAG: hypothetical protein COU54_00650 [Candidatus Pacearchaeota archaeon CG10_big_fil_rev_8_21_14_0_10_31_24]